MKVEEQLETFRIAFKGFRVNVEKDYMTYNVRSGLADAVAQEANELIEELGLSLVAIPSSLSSKSTVLIQSQYMQL